MPELVPPPNKFTNKPIAVDEANKQARFVRNDRRSSTAEADSEGATGQNPNVGAGQGSTGASSTGSKSADGEMGAQGSVNRAQAILTKRSSLQTHNGELAKYLHSTQTEGQS